MLISIPNEVQNLVAMLTITFVSKEDDLNQSIMVISAFDPDALDDPIMRHRQLPSMLQEKDGGRFKITPMSDTTAELSFVDFTEEWYLDYESPLDANGDREFEVLIQAFKDTFQTSLPSNG